MKYYFTLFIIIIFSCSKPPENNNNPLPEYKGIFVLNEGQWTLNNASLTFFNGNQPLQNVFKNVNNTALGDVANSIMLDNDTLYIIVNNSKIIYKVQMPTLKLIKELRLPASASPRNMIKINDYKTYVNSMLDNSIYVINPTNMTITKTIFIENYSEDIIKAGNKVYTSCGNYAYPKKNNKIAVINPNSDVVEKYIILPLENPGDLEQINDSTIIVVARGNYSVPKKSAIYFINIIKDTIQDSIIFNNYSFDAFYKPPYLYVISDEGINRINVNTKYVEKNFISKQMLGMTTNELLYSFYYDSTSRKYYIANAKYGGINGVCYILNENFQKIGEFETGVFPGTIFSYY